MMLCEIVEEGQEMPPSVVCSWSDDGKTYCLRNRPTPRTSREPEGDFMHSRSPNYFGISRCIWTLSPNIFCKVKSWTEGLTTEATTIRFVNEHIPSLPTEKVIYEWIDPEWNRTVMFSYRVSGTVYQEAWFDLTAQQRLQVADQVAAHFKSLAAFESDYIETVSGGPIAGAHSLRVREALPLWKHRIEPKVSREDYMAYAQRRDDGIEPLDAGESFVLQHPDCSPGNFFVTTPSNPDESPQVTAIIDWEKVGYYPKWRVATLPRGSEDFVIQTESFRNDDEDWQWMLSNACVRAGFPLHMDRIVRWGRRRLRNYPNAPIQCCINTSHLPDPEVRPSTWWWPFSS